MKIDIQGHRGCRGLMPENTIPAFEKAIELGVHTLEFDVVISKEKQVIVSHEPFMSHLITTQEDGSFVSEAEQESYNIFTMTYDDLKTYDVGTKYFERFPEQKKLKTHKPSLRDVIQKSKDLNPDILYNIEIKRKKKWDLTHHPDFKTFADLVINELTDLNVLQKSTVQCFDIETLQYINQNYHHVKLVFLVENKFPPNQNIAKLGFIPHVYSPYYKLVDRNLVDYCNSNNMKLIPWTVNEAEDMESLIDMGVHGIISDYPDRLIEVCSIKSKARQ